jgi:hypothetical protein
MCWRIRTSMPDGIPVMKVLGYMEFQHGLTNKTASAYLYSMQQQGIVRIFGGMAYIQINNFRNMIENIAPDRDPNTGAKREVIQDFDINSLKPKSKKLKAKINEDLDAHADKNKTSPGGPDV